MEPPRRRGPYAKTAERRATIGRAAMDLVHEVGHSAVTTEAVARRAGVTTATVNYHFPTRDELLVAALESREARVMPADPTPEITGLTAQALADQTRGEASSRQYVALYAAMAAAGADPDHPGHAWIRGHLRSARLVFADILRRLQEQGLAHPDVDPDRFGREMVAVWDGLQTQWLAEPDFDLGDAVAEAFRALTRADIMDAKRAIESLAAEL